MDTQPTYIVGLEMLNTLRLKAVNLSPNSKSVVLGGDNGQGKTSFLEAIAMVLGGADVTPDMPVHRGAEKGHIKIFTSDGLTIKLNLSAANGRGSLTIETKDKAKYSSPQAMLEKLVGRIAFDPLAFCELKADKQAAAVRNYVGLDFTALDAKRKTIYDERTLLNRNIAEGDVRAKALPAYPDAPFDEVSTTKLIDELTLAETHNRGLAKLQEAVRVAQESLDNTVVRLDNNQALISGIEADIALLQKQLEEARQKRKEILGQQAACEGPVAEAQRALEAFQLTDVAPIKAAIAKSAETNKQVQANKLRDDAFQALEEKQTKADALTKQIADIDADKAKQLSEAKFPVPGMSFEGDSVTFNGVPLAQCNFNERLRVSLAMGMATNPKLRVCIIRDASLLDRKNFATLISVLDELKIQGFIERVGDGKECTVIIEDGTVLEDRTQPAATETPVTAE